MIIAFKCSEENLVVYLESEVRPMVGDSILIKDKEYTVTKVIWALLDLPAQSGLVAYIK